MHRPTRGRRSRGRGMHQGRGRGNSSLDRALQDHPAPASIDQYHLHELDLELALLKRKRELLEQQQMMNENSAQPCQYDYNPGHYYEDPPAAAAAGERYDRPPGKRPATNWQQSGPKRFNAPRSKRPRPGPRDQRASGPAPPTAPPRATGPTVPTKSSSPKGRNHDLTKVTKHSRKPVPAQNKLTSYSVDERKNLVSQASHLAKESDEYILRENETASRKLLGRLELALGVYLRELKTEHESGPYATKFRSPSKLRALKQSIRERIRTAMLGKSVGAPQDVMACVREKYPKETDEDMIKEAQETEPLGSKSAIRRVDAVDPEMYIKQSFNLLLGSKLDEIFTQVRNLYANDADMGKTTQEVIDNLLLEPRLIISGDPSATNGEDPSKATDDPVKDGDETTPDTGKPETIKTPKDAADIQIEPLDNPLLTIREDKVSESKPTEAVDIDAKEADSAAGHAPGVKATNVANMIPQIAMDKPASFYNALVNQLLKRRLPQVLPKYKDQLIKILRSDSGYVESRAYILQEANKKAEAMYCEQAELKEPQVRNTQPKQRTFPFLVKIMGRPSLPKRKHMQEFLNKFHPACIRRHRGMHNLLLVYLNAQEDYDRIVAANNTTIGNTCLDIRVGGKGADNEMKLSTNDGLQTDSNSGDASNDGVSEPNTSGAIDAGTAEPKSDSFLDQSLDNQIADLLSSIRESEEGTRGDDLGKFEEEIEGQISKANGEQNNDEFAHLFYDDFKPSEETKTSEESKASEENKASEDNPNTVDNIENTTEDQPEPAAVETGENLNNAAA